MTVVGLGGGIGATRLWRALVPEVGTDAMTVVVNTADDLWHYGLRICPDIDTVIYGLSERQDTQRGWGLRGDTFSAMSTLQELGQHIWFNLGDRDIATHLLRTEMLRGGATLTETTDRLRRANHLEVRILPMCDQEVGTEVLEVDGGWIPFQQFHVKHHAEPTATAVRYNGIDQARTPRAVLEAIEAAELIVLGPSSPVASVLPILGVDRTRAAIRASSAQVVAVSPIVSGVPITNPGDAHRARCRERLLATLGVRHRAASVAALYADLIDVFIVDEADHDQAAEAEALGVAVIVAPTLAHLEPTAGNDLAAAIMAMSA